MIRPILTLLVLTTVSAFALDPVQDYLSRNTFPTRSSKFDGQLFSGQPWNGDNHQQPPGGYLLRFNAPIGADGTPVTFLASSLMAYLRGSNWFAYKETSSGATLLSDQVSFGHLNFYLAPATADRGPALCEILMGKTGFCIIAYYFDKTGKWVEGRLEGKPRDFAKEDADPHYLDHEGGDLALERHLTPFTPQIKKILLVEYLKNPSVLWRPCKDRSVRGQYLDPDEKEHVTAAKNFRKEDAAQMWKSKRPASTSQQISQ